jgi:exodeoxyribonuclease VII large subunit
VQTRLPVGEGSIKKAAALLRAKLQAVGLFDEVRKRPLPYPPQRIGLIASGESAAYHDFVKILNERWVGVKVEFADVQVQGDIAPGQIIKAIEYFNQQAEPPEVLVITRGGGSPEDLAAFSTEQVTRAVAASRIPTIVAIGHEVDVSLAELAADQRASTPSNAAQLLVPDKRHVLENIRALRNQLGRGLSGGVERSGVRLKEQVRQMNERMELLFRYESQAVISRKHLLKALNPEAALKRGYAIVRQGDMVVRSAAALKSGQKVGIQFADGAVDAEVK